MTELTQRVEVAMAHRVTVQPAVGRLVRGG